MQNANDQIDVINDISETLLIPLYARALETQSKHPLITDDIAVAITKQLNPVFAHSSSSLHRLLAKGKIRRTNSKKLSVFLSLRTRCFDRYCKEFLHRDPSGVIVELGCGLSSRFFRIDTKPVEWYDLDLPEVIAIRKRFMQETDRCKMIASSVLDYQWMDQLSSPGLHVLFIAEGLLMYLYEEEVKSLVLELQKRFPGCELVCEVQNTFVINALKKERWKRKFQKDHHLGSEAAMHFGIADGTVLESWGPGIRFLDEWTIFDDHEKKMGWMNLFAFSKRLRKAQWVVHYKLESR
jgi:methyltransferase (TIGR00027 family)